MAVTTQALEYQRLRSYLSPYLHGPNVDAVLTALAAGSSSYLINNAAAVNDQLYVVSASGQYLDYKLAEYGITRPTNIGLSDQIFSQIGLQVKNRKQVRDLMNQILDAIFGDQFTKAQNSATMIEPYNLQDGDTLIINYDNNNTTTITFSSSQFEDINAALAQEVADVITSTLNSMGLTGTAISQNNGNGNFVLLQSNTIGPRSSVTVLGGSAQNKLLFPAPVNAGGNSTTQWTVTLQAGGFLRYTWSGGANPNLGNLSVNDYVNIYGGGFTSSPNAGTYTITQAQGGGVGLAYFEVSNPLGLAGIFTQGSNSAVLFYNPVTETLASIPQYAALYQVEARTLQVFLPASTKVIRRGRIGSAHVHDPPLGTFLLNAQPNPGDIFDVMTGYTLVAGTNFVIGSNIEDTVNNIVEVINAADLNLLAINNTNNTILVENLSIDNTLTITYTGSANIIASGPEGDNTSLEPDQQGPYSYDLTQPFVVSSTNTTLSQTVTAISSRVIQVQSSVGFPNSFGYLIFGYGTSHQEGPVPYLGTPDSTTLLISPSYVFQNIQPEGTSVFYVAQNSPVTLNTIGTQYPFYVTDVVSGRLYAESLLQSVAATGINVVFTILYPGAIGLGKWGTPYSEISIIWGP